MPCEEGDRKKLFGRSRCRRCSRRWWWAGAKYRVPVGHGRRTTETQGTSWHRSCGGLMRIGMLFTSASSIMVMVEKMVVVVINHYGRGLPGGKACQMALCHKSLCQKSLCQKSLCQMALPNGALSKWRSVKWRSTKWQMANRVKWQMTDTTWRVVLLTIDQSQ